MAARDALQIFDKIWETDFAQLRKFRELISTSAGN